MRLRLSERQLPHGPRFGSPPGPLRTGVDAKVPLALEPLPAVRRGARGRVGPRKRENCASSSYVQCWTETAKVKATGPHAHPGQRQSVQAQLSPRGRVRQVWPGRPHLLGGGALGAPQRATAPSRSPSWAHQLVSVWPSRAVLRLALRLPGRQRGVFLALRVL